MKKTWTSPSVENLDVKMTASASNHGMVEACTNFVPVVGDYYDSALYEIHGGKCCLKTEKHHTES